MWGDLREFVDCYNADNRHLRRAGERFRFYSFDELIARDKASLDIFWLKDDSLEAARAAFRDVAASLPRTLPVETD